MLKQFWELIHWDLILQCFRFVINNERDEKEREKE